MRCFEELDVLLGDTAAVRSLEEVMATLVMPVKKNQKCPFAVLGGPNPHKIVGGSMSLSSTTAAISTPTTASVDAAAIKGECPWPFILLHDPVRGLQNPLSIVLLVIVLAMFYRQVLNAVGI